jgi:hypothetical protein
VENIPKSESNTPLNAASAAALAAYCKLFPIINFLSIQLIWKKEGKK